MKKFFIRKMLIWIPILIMEIVALLFFIIMLIKYMTNEYYEEYKVGLFVFLIELILPFFLLSCFKVVRYIRIEKECESTVFNASISYKYRGWNSTHSIMVHKTLNPNFCQEIVTGKLIPVNKKLYSEDAYKLNRDFWFKSFTVWEKIDSSKLVERYIKEATNKEIIFGNIKFTSINEFLDWLIKDVEIVNKYCNTLRECEHKKINTILKETKN